MEAQCVIVEQGRAVCNSSCSASIYIINPTITAENVLKSSLTSIGTKTSSYEVSRCTDIFLLLFQVRCIIRNIARDWAAEVLLDFLLILGFNVII